MSEEKFSSIGRYTEAFGDVARFVRARRNFPQDEIVEEKDRNGM
jgi:hypothetical protein